MNDSDFNIITTNLQNKIDMCHKYLGKIKSTDDLLKLTLSDTIELKKFCISEKEKMTKVLMVDLYHIIGMGNLTCSQTSKFISLIKEYASYRPDIKTLSKGLDSIEELPNIPTATKFRLLELGKVTLTRDVQGSTDIVEDDEGIQDYFSVNYVNSDFNTFKINSRGSKIYINLTSTSLEEFVVEITKKSIMNSITVVGIQDAITKNKQYGGGVWSQVADVVVCDITSSTIRNMLTKHII